MKGEKMRHKFSITIFTMLLLAGCDSKQPDKADSSADEAKVEVVQETTEATAPVVSETVLAESVTTQVAETVEKVVEVKADKTGEQVYKQSCVACHASGAAGAPKMGDAAAWKPRIDKGVEALYASVMNGIPGTAMMAKGTCAACSEAELNAAVDYMLLKVR